MSKKKKKVITILCSDTDIRISRNTAVSIYKFVEAFPNRNIYGVIQSHLEKNSHIQKINIHLKQLKLSKPI
jgi:hypothetical protein